MTKPILDIRDLSKTYPGRHGTQANKNIDLMVRPGEIVGLLGHNGAGKTTLVNQIVGILRPTSGSITVDGIDVVAHPAAARRLVSVQAQANVPITGMSPRNAIQLVARIRGMSKKKALERADLLIEQLDMQEWAGKPAQSVSGGVARLTAFATALASPGKLVILDEPTNDVDPVRRRLLWERIRALSGQGIGVLLVTHNVLEAEHAVDKLVILEHGRVIASGTPTELANGASDEMVLRFEGGPEVFPDYLRMVSAAEREIVARVGKGQAVQAVEWAAANTAGYSLSPVSLEDTYISLSEEGSVA